MELETMNDLILSYGVILGKRHSEKQKIAFLRSAKKQFEKENFSVDITKITSTFMKSEKRNFYNLYAGDFKHAHTLVVSYYDTSSSCIIPEKQKAFSSGYSKSTTIAQSIIMLLFITMIASIVYFGLVPKLEVFGLVSVWGFMILAICLLTFYAIIHVREGITNRYHMVRNSSSLIAMFLSASTLAKEDKYKIAYACIDEGTQSEYGLKMLEEYIGARKVKRIYLDSIGNEGTVQCFTDIDIPVDKTIEKHKREEYMKCYGDILFTSGNFDKGDVIIPKANTRKDKSLSEENVLKISNKINELVML